MDVGTALEGVRIRRTAVIEFAAISLRVCQAGECLSRMNRAAAPFGTIPSLIGQYLSWLERFLDTEEVDGSSPFGPTNVCNDFRSCLFRRLVVCVRSLSIRLSNPPVTLVRSPANGAESASRAFLRFATSVSQVGTNPAEADWIERYRTAGRNARSLLSVVAGIRIGRYFGPDTLVIGNRPDCETSHNVAKLATKATPPPR